MSLQSSVGNVTRGATESVKSIISSSTSKLETIVGTASTSVTNVWSGGFIGIDTKNSSALETAITKYIEGVQNTIQGFNENANLENAYKGAIQEATQDFLKAIKELLQAHVSVMKINLSDFNEAIQKYESFESETKDKIEQQVADIRTNAQSIKID